MIYFIVGTKAQLIKTAPLMVELGRRNIQYTYISTGQHHNTMDELHQNFGIREPDKILVDSSDVTTIFRFLVWMMRMFRTTVLPRRDLFPKSRSGVVVVHGDTASTLMGSLIARRNGLPVAHVEAGLRSFNLFSPFPEELVRIVVSRMAAIYFCPGEWATKNIKKSKPEAAVINTCENTLLDSLRIARKCSDYEELRTLSPYEHFGVVTVHRFENFATKSASERVVDCITVAAKIYPLVFVMHDSTKKALERFELLDKISRHPGIHVIGRQDYFSFIALVSNSDFVLSDGGSNQEECFYLGKPIALIRKATERPEGLGLNCFISEIEPRKVEWFVKNYNAYKTISIVDELSPSKIICDHLDNYRQSVS